MTTPYAAPAVPRRGRLAAVGVPLLVISVVIMMVVPLPPALLDLLLAANLSAAVVVLLTAMMVQRPLDFSVFPALLLVTTLVRLALNVSTTRLVLLHGEAGKVIDAFGGFVVGGNLVVGLVIFLILVVIQFAVITSGAGRVAEVSARFTLDAMPGKQMAIDADLNAGLITDSEAKRRRADVAREADFYGAMDGASKFVKGDAIAAVVIVVINLVGGFAIGMVQQGLTAGESISRFALLSVGDGLVSQIPALLISVASGIVVTRVTGEFGADRDGGLGSDIVGQLTRSPRALRIAALAVFGLGLLPNLPKLPFFAVALGLLLAATRAGTADDAESPAPPEPDADPDSPEALLDTLAVDPLELHLAPDLLDLLDPETGSSLTDRVRALRRRVAEDLGLVVPPIRTRDQALLPPSTYTVSVHGVEVARGSAPLGHCLVLGDPAETGAAGLPGHLTTDPVFGLPAMWVRTEVADVLATDGATVVDRGSLIVTHLSEVVRSHAGDLLSRQDVSVLVASLKRAHPVLAGEVGGEALSLGEVQRVLRELLDEGVPVRDLARVLEAVTAKARETRSPEALVEAARVALGPSITLRAATNGRLAAVTFDPLLEQSLLEAVRAGDSGSWLAVDGPRLEGLLEGLSDAVLSAEQAGHRPVLVCAAQLRPAVRRLVSTGRPDLAVLSYPELSRSVTIEPVGVVRVVQHAT